MCTIAGEWNGPAGNTMHRFTSSAAKTETKKNRVFRRELRVKQLDLSVKTVPGIYLETNKISLPGTADGKYGQLTVEARRGRQSTSVADVTILPDTQRGCQKSTRGRTLIIMVVNGHKVDRILEPNDISTETPILKSGICRIMDDIASEHQQRAPTMTEQRGCPTNTRQPTRRRPWLEPGDKFFQEQHLPRSSCSSRHIPERHYSVNG